MGQPDAGAAVAPSNAPAASVVATTRTLHFFVGIAAPSLYARIGRARMSLTGHTAYWGFAVRGDTNFRDRDLPSMRLTPTQRPPHRDGAKKGTLIGTDESSSFVVGIACCGGDLG